VTPDAVPASMAPGMRYAGYSFLLTALISFASAIVVARLYGIEVVGQFALVLVPYVITSKFSTLSEQVALTRRLATMTPRAPAATALFLAVLGFSTLLTIAVGGGILVLNYFILNSAANQPQLLMPSVILIAAYVLLDNPSWNLDAVFSGFHGGAELFWGRFSQVSTALIATIALAPFRPGVWGPVLGLVTGFAVALAVRLAMAHRYLTRHVPANQLRVHLSELPSLLRFGAALLPANLFETLAGQAGYWVLASVSTVQQVGAYSRCMGLAQRLEEGGFRACDILFPNLVARHERGHHDAFDSALADTIRGVVFVFLLPASVAAGAAHGVLQLLFGEDFTSGSLALSILLLAYVGHIVGMMAAQALIAVGRLYIAAALSVGRYGVMLLLLYPFVSRWGASGLAANFALCLSGELIVMAVMLRRSHLAALSAPAVVRTVVVCSLAAAAAFLCAHFIDGALGFQAGVLIAVLVGAVIYLAVALGGKAVGMNDLRQLRGAR
jgi:O-antigen/teichoic acid export membrane protein